MRQDFKKKIQFLDHELEIKAVSGDEAVIIDLPEGVSEDHAKALQSAIRPNFSYIGDGSVYLLTSEDKKRFSLSLEEAAKAFKKENPEVMLKRAEAFLRSVERQLQEDEITTLEELRRHKGNEGKSEEPEGLWDEAERIIDEHRNRGSSGKLFPDMSREGIDPRVVRVMDQASRGPLAKSAEKIKDRCMKSGLSEEDAQKAAVVHIEVSLGIGMGRGR